MSFAVRSVSDQASGYLAAVVAGRTGPAGPAGLTGFSATEAQNVSTLGDLSTMSSPYAGVPTMLSAVVPLVSVLPVPAKSTFIANNRVPLVLISGDTDKNMIEVPAGVGPITIRAHGVVSLLYAEPSVWPQVTLTLRSWDSKPTNLLLGGTALVSSTNQASEDGITAYTFDIYSVVSEANRATVNYLALFIHTPDSTLLTNHRWVIEADKLFLTLSEDVVPMTRPHDILSGHTVALS
jgi:hypothetical protein